MKDLFFLVVAGLTAAVVAWAFWHFLGQQAFVVLLAIVLAGLLLDNRKLRKEVDRLKNSPPS